MSLVPYPPPVPAPPPAADDSRPLPLTILRGHASQVQALAFSLDEKILYSGDLAGELRVWELESGRPVQIRHFPRHDRGILSLHVFEGPGEGTRTLVSQGRGGVHALWRLGDDGSIPSDPYREIVEDAYTFCRSALLSMPVEASPCGAPSGSPRAHARARATLLAVPVDEGRSAAVLRCDHAGRGVVLLARHGPEDSKTRGTVTALALVATGGSARQAGKDAQTGGRGDGEGETSDPREATPEAHAGDGASAPNTASDARTEGHPRMPLADTAHGSTAWLVIGYESGVVDAWEVAEWAAEAHAAGSNDGRFRERSPGRRLPPDRPRRTHPLKVMAKEPVLALVAGRAGRACVAVGAAARGATFALDVGGKKGGGGGAPRDQTVGAAVGGAAGGDMDDPRDRRAASANAVAALASVVEAGTAAAAGAAADADGVIGVRRTSEAETVVPVPETARSGADETGRADKDHPPRLRSPKVLRLPRQGANDAALRADGRIAILAGWDGVARAVDVATGETVAKLKYHSDQVMAVVYAPSGSLLATASGDGTVALWSAANDGGRARTLLGAA